MKKTLLATALVASQATAQSWEEYQLQDVDRYFTEQCIEVWNNTRQQCAEALYKHWVAAGRHAAMMCMLPRADYDSQADCRIWEVQGYIKDNWETILEDVTSPIWEEL